MVTIGFLKFIGSFSSELYNTRLIPWHCFACTCMWLLARTFPQVGQAQWPRPRCNSFTWRLQTGLLANSLPHIPQEKPPPVASICSSTKPKWVELVTFYGRLYLVCKISLDCLWNLRIVHIARTAIDVVLNFAPMETLVTVGAWKLAHAEMRFFHMSSAIGSFHKLLAAEPTCKPSGCSCYMTINTWTNWYI